MRDFKEALTERVKETERIIEDYLPPVKGRQETILEAMAYSMKAGGSGPCSYQRPAGCSAGRRRRRRLLWRRSR